MNIRKNPTELIVCAGMIICAVLIGYNVFYQPQAQEIKYIPYTSSEIAELSEGSAVSGFDTVNDHFNGGRLNINLATETELAENLDGISTSLAKRIIEYRTQNGNFSDISDIMKVKGIGEKKFQNIKSKICV